MTSEELREHMEYLGLSGVELVAIINRHSGLDLQPSQLYRMASVTSATARKPSAVVRTVVSMLMAQEQSADARADELADALRQSGLRLIKARK